MKSKHPLSRLGIAFEDIFFKGIKIAAAVASLALFVWAFETQACDKGKLTLDVGAGYKLRETKLQGARSEAYNKSKGPTAFIALTYEKGPIQYQFAHDSNWLIGRPFNDDRERSLWQFRVNYRFNLLDF